MLRLDPPSLSLALILSACATAPGLRVEEATLDGAHGLDAGDVLQGLSHHPPDGWFYLDHAVYEPLAIPVDRRRIESYYRRHGWFSAKVTDVEITQSGDGVAVRFVVEEGQPSLLTEVHLGGTPPEEEQGLRALTAPLRIGEPFDYDAYEAVKVRLRKALVAHGFAFAEVSGHAQVDRDRLEVRAIYTVEPGPAVRIGEITVEGLDRLPEGFVRGRCALAPGDRFDPERLDVTRSRILETGLAESVRFGWDRDHPTDRLAVGIGVSEGPRNELRFGFGFGRGNGYQLRALASYARKSFFDPLLTLRLTVRPSWELLVKNADKGGPSIEARAELERQDLIWTRLVGTLAVEYRFVQLEAYLTNGPSLAVALDRPFLDDRLRVGIRLQYDHLAVTPRFDPALKDDALRSIGIESPLRLLSASPFLGYDGRDDPVDPRLGYYAELRFEVGQAFGLGAYSTVIPELRGYVPIFWRRLVLAGRARFGGTLFASPTLPITRRFFAGGPESQRGFNRRRLAPRRGDPALPVGGTALLETNVELRLDLFELFGQWFGVAIFADGADVTERLGALDPLHLHWAAGGGIRYRTPVGAIRLDVGVRLNRTGDGEPDPTSHYAIHFSLGEAF